MGRGVAGGKSRRAGDKIRCGEQNLPGLITDAAPSDEGEVGGGGRSGTSGDGTQ